MQSPSEFALVLFSWIICLEAVGEKAFNACKHYGENMLECQNILYPNKRVRVPIDILLYPHMVLIGYKTENDDLSWKCGGTLISDRWVMTAAHCKDDTESGPAHSMKLGTATFEFDEVEDLEQERLIAEFIVHPGYQLPSKYNDIALARAQTPFLLNRDIRIACLNIHDDIGNKSLTAIGFGSTTAGAQMGSKTLMKVDVEIVDKTLCNKTMKFMIKRKILPGGITDNQICAGDYVEGGKDTCQGDSGGPLQMMDGRVDCIKSFPLHTVVGITSFGRDCGRKMSPGVYTRVSKYIEWIEGIVWP